MSVADGSVVEAWLRERRCASHFTIMTSSMKFHMVVFQLNGSTLLWWKMLLPQLNMVVEDMSWELFEEQFRERYLSDEFIERQFNEINAL
jgi:hypothetical protein